MDRNTIRPVAAESKLANKAAWVYAPLRICLYILFLAHLLIGFFVPSHWLSDFNNAINSIQFLALIWLIEVLHADRVVATGFNGKGSE